MLSVKWTISLDVYLRLTVMFYSLSCCLIVLLTKVNWVICLTNNRVIFLSYWTNLLRVLVTNLVCVMLLCIRFMLQPVFSRNVCGRIEYQKSWNRKLKDGGVRLACDFRHGVAFWWHYLCVLKSLVVYERSTYTSNSVVTSQWESICISISLLNFITE